MPKKLSLQNAKKQVVEYMIYIITMVITVALLLSFNMIIFSEEIAAIINEKSILPLILITVSVLVVLVISALVKHITVFMVRKRSREFGLYMLLGVENNDIAKMFMFEFYLCICLNYRGFYRHAVLPDIKSCNLSNVCDNILF